jgi:hypothetical protein
MYKMNYLPKATALAVMMLFGGQINLSYADGIEITTKPIEVKGILPTNLESVPGAYAIVDQEQLDVRRPFSIQEALNNLLGELRLIIRKVYSITFTPFQKAR